MRRRLVERQALLKLNTVVSDLIIKPNGGELRGPNDWTVEELRENLILGFHSALKQASGIRDSKEYHIMFGKTERQLEMYLDHLIIKAGQ